MFENIISLLRDIQNINILENEPMSNHTTFKIGGPASLFVEVFDISSLTQTMDILSQFEIKPFILGNGSNLLVSDNGYKGIVLKNSCKSITVSGNKIFAESGALLSSVAKTALNASLSGLEFAHGIPGTVGGALVMNAGAYDGEISGVLSKSSYYSLGKVYALKRDEHRFSYRNSIYKQTSDFTVLSAEFELTPGDPEMISARMQELSVKRREKQPLEFPSAGSTFKRPEGYFAGALIEQCGLKGFSIGGAQVSEKHSGFIINRDKASASDVLFLIEHIKSEVYKRFGVMLECEICLL